MAKVFALYKGRYPIGSIVQLSSSRPGVVLSHGETEAGKLRPLLGLLGEDGTITDRVDLSAQEDLRISGVISTQKAGIRLSDL